MCKPKSPTITITPPPSGGSSYAGEMEMPGPSESEKALVDIASEKYDRFKEYYDPVEASWLEDQSKDFSDYGAMMGYADAAQATMQPKQINMASGAGAAGLAGLATAQTGGAAAARASANAADFQRRNANKLWGLSAANKLQAANQSSLASVANSASSAAISVASSAQNYQNRMTAATAQAQHSMDMMKYNYNQGKVQNLAALGASLLGYYKGGPSGGTQNWGYNYSSGQQGLGAGFGNMNWGAGPGMSASTPYTTNSYYGGLGVG